LGTSLQLDVVLAPKDPSMLASFIDELYDPTSAEYDHFLAPRALRAYVRSG
jgi:hypothetical protein